jgi:hypothetical protein
MQFPTLMLGAIATLMGMSSAEQSTYLQQLSTLSEGAVDTQTATQGIVWLNVTNFAPDKLPYIQQDLGLYTYDNLDGLKATASLAATAASNLKYGDLVYFFTAFAMNGYGPYIQASSNEMQQGLLVAVSPPGSTTPDQKLIQLYADTSSIASLREAFLALKTLTLDRPTAPPTSLNARGELWTKTACDKAHQAVTSACRTLISSIQFNATWKSGGPRSICKSGCCISWSANATFQIQNLTNAANYCVSTCANSKVSCEVWGVNLQGTVVDQCLSNRADGCK